jgi:signal transduction histidine kinase
VDSIANNEVDILTRALRRMRSNLKSSYANLDEKNKNLNEQLLELTQAYRSLQKTQRELELASRRIIEAEDSQRFALTTYIHDEILRPLDDINVIARELAHRDLIKLGEELEGRIRQVRFDLSVPILRDIGIELRRLAQETLPAIYPNASRVSMQLDLAALDEDLKLAPGCIFLIYRFVRGAIGNVYRHSQATAMQVLAEICDGQLILCVSDNGKGFDLALIESFIKSGHYFFHDIQIRTKQLNGNFLIESLSEQGTRLQLSLPFSSRNTKKNRKASIPRTNHKLSG